MFCRCFHCITDFKYCIYKDKSHRENHNGELEIVFEYIDIDLKPYVNINSCKKCLEDYCFNCEKIIDTDILDNDEFDNSEKISRYEEIMEEHKNCNDNAYLCERCKKCLYQNGDLCEECFKQNGYLCEECFNPEIYDESNDEI